jgi:hypothetical protein
MANQQTDGSQKPMFKINGNILAIAILVLLLGCALYGVVRITRVKQVRSNFGFDASMDCQQIGYSGPVCVKKR